jgi:purine-nucleoside phosphorylase
MPGGPYALADASARALAAATGAAHHDVVVVLGSGWGGAADQLGIVDAELRARDLPGFVAPVADGHLGTVRSSRLGTVRVLTFLGRTHLYEGHGPDAVAHAVRTAAAAGCRAGVLTNACGSLHPEWETGTGVLLRDHLNLSGSTPLTGARFVDVTATWSPTMRTWAREVSPELVEGVYAMMAGPQYQTLAETAMLRGLGADVVGMSTVLEAVAAREAGMELMGLSVVATREGTGEQIDPQQVVAVAAAAAEKLGGTVAAVIERWGSHVRAQAQ